MKTWKPMIFGVAAVAALVCLLNAGQADARRRENVIKLLETNECVNCNLRDADLAMKNLRGADLTGAILNGADLLMTDLYGAKLIRADLSDANLDMADLTHADYTGAKLDGAVWTDGRRCAEGSIGECK